MNQYNRLLDPKKDIGRYSGTLAIYLLVMTLVTVLWEVLLGLTLAGSLRKDPSQVTEKLNALNVWAGIPYLISISIGLFLFNAYRKKALYKYDLKHKGRKMTLSVFFILLAFLGFSQVFSSVMTQVIERMFETIGLHSPTPDLGDLGPCSCMLAFLVLSQRNSSSVGLACEAWNGMAKSLLLS